MATKSKSSKTAPGRFSRVQYMKKTTYFLFLIINTVPYLLFAISNLFVWNINAVTYISDIYFNICPLNSFVLFGCAMVFETETNLLITCCSIVLFGVPIVIDVLATLAHLKNKIWRHPIYVLFFIDVILNLFQGKFISILITVLLMFCVRNFKKEKL